MAQSYKPKILDADGERRGWGGRKDKKRVFRPPIGEKANRGFRPRDGHARTDQLAVNLVSSGPQASIQASSILTLIHLPVDPEERSKRCR